MKLESQMDCLNPPNHQAARRGLNIETTKRVNIVSKLSTPPPLTETLGISHPLEIGCLRGF